MDNRNAPPLPELEDNRKTYTLEELLTMMEPMYQQQKDIMGKCIRGLTAYASGSAADGQGEKLSWTRKLIEEIIEFFCLEAPEQYLTAFDQTVSEARDPGQAVLSEQDKVDILAGLEQYTDELRVYGEDYEPWVSELTGFMNELWEQWRQSLTGPEEHDRGMERMNIPDRDVPVPAQSGNEKRYTVDEFLAQIEPQYREDKETMRKCIAGLTEYAAQMAAQHQEEDLLQFRRLCIEMAEFWGLTDDDTPKGYQKMAEQYGSAFDQAVSAARESGQAPEMSEQARRSILDGLELYAQEIRANDESLEDWAVECDVLADELERQWRMESAISKPSDMQMGGM